MAQEPPRDEGDYGEGEFRSDGSSLFDSPEYQLMLKRYREKIQKVLAPYEAWIMKAQTILVWENPTQSAVLLLIFNIVFWLFTISGYRFYHLAASSLLLIFISHSWITRIWPEIKAVPNVVSECSWRISNPVRSLFFYVEREETVPVRPEDETEDWTPLEPGLLGVPELSAHLAEVLTMTVIYYDWLWATRRSKPGRFCMLVSGVCILGICVGHCVPGPLLCYILLLSLLLWPCISYHSLIKKLYMKFEPLLMQLEYSMKIKRSHTRTRHRSQSREADAGEDGEDRVVTDTDSELDEFLPCDPTTAALARSITDSEDESPFTSRSQSPLASGRGASGSGAPRDTRSRDLMTSSVDDFAPDDRNPIPDYLEAEDSSLSLLPLSIPSIDELDRRDSSKFAPMNFPDSETDVTPSASSPMQFVSDYFQSSGESSEENEDKLASGLEVPDLGETVEETAASQTAAYVASVAADTFSAASQGVASGLSALAGYVRDRGNTSSVEITEITDDDVDGMVADDGDVAMATGDLKEMSPSPTSLSAEYEFVEHSDIQGDSN